MTRYPPVRAGSFYPFISLYMICKIIAKKLKLIRASHPRGPLARFLFHFISSIMNMIHFITMTRKGLSVLSELTVKSVVKKLKGGGYEVTIKSPTYDLTRWDIGLINDVLEDHGLSSVDLY